MEITLTDAVLLQGVIIMLISVLFYVIMKIGILIAERGEKKNE